MAHSSAVFNWTELRAWTRKATLRASMLSSTRLFRPVALVLSLSLLATSPAAAQPVPGSATFSSSGGYARLVLKLNEDVETDVSVAGTVLLIRFKKPVKIPVGRLSDAVPDYVSSARRDPDGTAIRLALSRSVKVNTMVAGERVFIDLLPDGWKGPLPSLPQEVIQELAERARKAERALRLQRAAQDGQPLAPIRVRASVQPTFVRFSFELPDGVAVTSTRVERKFTMAFNAPLKFDLADAKISAPPNVASITERLEADGSVLELALIGETDVYTFREDRSYYIDVGSLPAGRMPAGALIPGVVDNGKTNGAQPAKPAPDKKATSDSVKTDKPPGEKSQAAEPKPKAEAVEPVKVDKKAGLAADTTPDNKVTSPAPSAPVAVTEPPQDKSSQDKTPAVAPASAPAASTPSVATKSASQSVDVTRSSDGVRIRLKLDHASPAALFRRGEILWVVLDDGKPLDLSSAKEDGGMLITDISRIQLDNGQALRIRLDRPQLASLSQDSGAEGDVLTITLADARQTLSRPLAALRNISERSQSSVSVALSQPGALHKIVDPDAGDVLSVVTAMPPSQGFIRRQDFVEFSLMETVHGVVVQAKDDSVKVDVGTDKVTLTRPGGLTLSPADGSMQRISTVSRPVFDVGQWRADQDAKFADRLASLTHTITTADPADRTQGRLDLARFYMAHGMYHEAKGVADLALADAKPGQENPVALIVRAVANAMIGRPDETLKDLNQPVLGPGYDSEVWRGLAFAAKRNWVPAREKFLNAGMVVSSLPVDLQRAIMMQTLRASLEVKDYSTAANSLSELDIIGTPGNMKASATLLSGWLDDALGRESEALTKYRAVAESDVRPAAAEAKFREVALRLKRNDLQPAAALAELETVAVTWRGGDTEVAALQMLSRLYAELGRYSDSFAAARWATERQADSPTARQVQDDAAQLFAEIFLSTKGDEIPPIDALALFYEFRELTPIGRRGDEMIRRLSDRLAAVDLLDQASELLQYQIDNRLEGAARAQVASRLAMLYLTARKPERAIAALRSTRISDLAGELRQQRLLLEARAQSDIGRRDLALDFISNLTGPEAIRLRSDIYWASRRWREAAEQIELYYGDRWRDFTPLTEIQKSDVIRAVVGYALAGDALGLARFREKYAPLMASPADKLAFDTATMPAASSSSEFAAIAKLAARVDTLDGFLAEMRTRFPDTSAKVHSPDSADPMPTGQGKASASKKTAEVTR